MMPPRPAARLAPLVALAASALAACSPSAPSRAATSPLAERLRALRRATAGADRWARPAVVELRVADDRRATRRAAPTATPAVDTTDWPTRVIPITTTHAAARTLWVGDRLALDAPPVPEGTPAAMAADLRWSTDEPAVARVSGDGEVVALAPGETDVQAWRAVGATLTPLHVLPAVRGHVVAADGGALRARVVVRTPDGVDTVATDAAGGFVVRLPRASHAAVAVAIDALDQPADYTEAHLDGVGAEHLGDLEVVLLPARWTVRGGRFAGERVPIAPAIVQSQASRGSRFWRVAGGGDGANGRPAVGWPAALLPIPVAFDRAVGVMPLDSIGFWRIARQLEADWGTRLFTPATLAPRDSVAAGTIVVTVDPRIGAEGLTTTSWNGTGDVSDALVAVRTRALLADPAIVTHELLHALGIGHAGSGWSSVMHPTTDTFADGRASREDIAYGQLLYAVRARTHVAAGRIPVGIAEAAAASPVP